MKKIMIYAELIDGAIDPSYYELLSKAKEIYGGEVSEFAAILLGSGIDAAVEEVEGSGVEKLYYLDDKRLSVFHPDHTRNAASEAVLEYDPDILLFGATASGEELAPSLGMVCNTGVAAHCTDLALNDDGELAQMVPAFGGKVIGEIFTPKTKPQIASVKPGMFKAVKQEPAACEKIALSKSVLDKTETKIEVVGITRDEVKGVPLEKADIVICGGHGVGSEENWKSLSKLAEKLGGAVGCTRPVVDTGWVEDEKTMIGTSGKSISPKVYIGSGIGGATHHVCGMKDAGLIININKDPDAESFDVSDYIVIGDGNEIIDALMDRLS